jgi:hypothetical protein
MLLEQMSPTAHTHRGLAAIIAVMAMLWLAGCGSSGKTPSADGPASSEAAASSNAASSSGSKRTGAETNATHQEIAAARQAVVKMTKCFEEQGIKVPPQKLHAADPVFSMNGINTKTKQFHTAYTICLPKAVGVYKAALGE